MESIVAPPESGLYLTVRGQGPVVVFVHGALGDYRQWGEISETLSANYLVIGVSRRHHWPNPMPTRDASYTYESNWADLQLLLDAIGHPVHLVGHSYGAGVVLLAALRSPSSVRSLALIEPAVGSLLAGITQPAAEQASRESMVEAVKSLAQAGKDGEAAETLIGWTQANTGGFGALPQAVRDWIFENEKTVGPMNAGPPPIVTATELRNLHIPVLLMRGERSRTWYRLIGDVVIENVPGAEASTIASAGHMLIVEKPVETAAALAGFLAKCERGI